MTDFRAAAPSPGVAVLQYLRFEVAVALAVLAGWLSRLLTSGRGRTLPGRLLLLLAPDALGRLSARHRLILISGTNGKTTTTAMLAAALQGHGSVVTNGDGANLASGVTATLMRARRRPASWAVLEVDEVALGPVLAQTAPELLVLLNLSRDQLDRTAEVTAHVRRWSELMAAAPGTAVVANSDDALVVAAVVAARDQADDVLWVAAGKPYREDMSLCPRCGAAWDARAVPWRCATCGLTQPSAGWRLASASVMTVGAEGFELDLNLPGRANGANAVMACAVAHRLGVSIGAALTRIRTVREVDGRYAQVNVGGTNVRLLLAKNPAGWVEAFDQLAGSCCPVVVAVNARDADGTDPSWLWDVPFEQLKGRPVLVAGDRAWDVAVRLLYAEVPHRVIADVASCLRELGADDCVVVSNYTAFLSVRAALVGTP